MSFYREFVRIFLINHEKSVDFAVELGYIIARKRTGSDIGECVGVGCAFYPCPYMTDFRPGGE